MATGSWKQITQWSIPSGASSVGMAPDEQLMAVGYRNGILGLIQASDGHVLAMIPAHSRWITGSTFAPDGKYLATSSEDGLVKLWDPVTRVELATLKGHLLGVHSVVASPDGRRLATGSNAKEAVKIWDLATRQELLNLQGEGSQFDRTQFSPDGNLLVSVNSGGRLHYWRAPSVETVNSADRAAAR
jgi:WD40 repeat protein